MEHAWKPGKVKSVPSTRTYSRQEPIGYIDSLSREPSHAYADQRIQPWRSLPGHMPGHTCRMDHTRGLPWTLPDLSRGLILMLLLYFDDDRGGEVGDRDMLRSSVVESEDDGW
ncbi:hypothetical protein BDZ45DRAFT_669841 [Acephala macrosclerotiorum]|nr:hypothetical protein BDZ45DRAFT_669841 [Acephala macrosclerotiorum]